MQMNFIANQSTPALAGQTIDVLDPSDGQVFDQIPRSQAADIDAAVVAARAAFNGPWGKLSAMERGRLLMKLSQKVIEHAAELAALEQRDCGKPTKQAAADSVALARYFEFYAGACDKLHGETLPYQNGYSVLTWREPHGVTGHVIPWNFPPGAINIVTGYGHEVGDALARHPGIDHISFTGSPRVGTLIQQVAAERHCPVTLELGGKSPQIIFDDADLDAAIPLVVNAIVQNSGQTCSAGSRVLIQQGIYEPLLKRLGEAFGRLQVGSAAMNLDLGPLIRASQLERVTGFLDQARADGIATVAQGQIAAGVPAGGFYQAPTLLRDVPVMHRLAQEEVFGPVLSAMSFTDEDHAVELANATEFGLVAGIWTRDGGRQFRMAKRVRSGQVFINNYGAGGGVELPFGGVKSSGYGREKGFEALLGFTTLKTVAIQHG
jgi:aldehyde dehydrogenase (NAD+)